MSIRKIKARRIKLVGLAAGMKDKKMCAKFWLTTWKKNTKKT
jgi:hypothetical protein